MKRLLQVFFAVSFCLSCVCVGTAFCGIGISVNSDQWDIGTGSNGEWGSSTFTVTNIGDETASISIRATNTTPDNWALQDVPGKDQFSLLWLRNGVSGNVLVNDSDLYATLNPGLSVNFNLLFRSPTSLTDPTLTATQTTNVTLSAASILLDLSKQWTRQLGTGNSDDSFGVAVDGSGNVYVAGYTSGSLDGNTNAGTTDIFLVKYDSSGTKLWTRMSGAYPEDQGKGVVVDNAGNIYIAGHTTSALDGNTNAGSYDVCLIKYDPAGNKQWTKLCGGNSGDFVTGVTTDGSSVYINGWTNGTFDGNTNSGGSDTFLVKYDANGTRLWTRLVGGGSDDRSNGSAADGLGNIYITGMTGGALDGNSSVGGPDVFLVKYNSAGVKQWTKQFGSNQDDYGYGIAADNAGNVYVSGLTNGRITGNTDTGEYNRIFLAKYDANGTQQWTRQFGSCGDEFSTCMTADTSGNLYIAGYSRGSLNGNTNAGGQDIFVMNFDMNGTWLWTKQYGTSSDDFTRGAARDSTGGIYLTGYTNGGLDGNVSAGSMDFFVTKFK